jgi:hypothetical protein
VIVISGFGDGSRDLADLALLAAARTSAIELLKVRGIAPLDSVLLNSWEFELFLAGAMLSELVTWTGGPLSLSNLERFGVAEEVVLVTVRADERGGCCTMLAEFLATSPRWAIRSWRTRILGPGEVAASCTVRPPSGEAKPGLTLGWGTRGMRRMVDSGDRSSGVRLPSVWRLARTASPGVWLRVGAAGASRSGRVLAERSAWEASWRPSYAVIRFFTDLM